MQLSMLRQPRVFLLLPSVLSPCVGCVSERPIIWQSSEILSVQRFLGRPLCLFPWTRPYRAWCGHREGCILTTWLKYLRRRLWILSTMSCWMLSWFFNSWCLYFWCERYLTHQGFSGDIPSRMLVVCSLVSPSASRFQSWRFFNNEHSKIRFIFSIRLLVAIPLKPEEVTSRNFFTWRAPR